MGFVYYRKQPFHALADIVKPALRGCRLLEEGPTMRGRLKFSTDEVLIFVNDRLLAPNTEESFSQLEPQLCAALKEILGKSYKLTRTGDDARERLTIRAKVN
jgi:hypothetical protein